MKVTPTKRKAELRDGVETFLVISFEVLDVAIPEVNCALDFSGI